MRKKASQECKVSRNGWAVDSAPGGMRGSILALMIRSRASFGRAAALFALTLALAAGAFGCAAWLDHPIEGNNDDMKNPGTVASPIDSFGLDVTPLDARAIGQLDGMLAVTAEGN